MWLGRARDNAFFKPSSHRCAKNETSRHRVERHAGCGPASARYVASPLSAPEQVLVVDRALRGIQLADFLERELPGVHRVALRALITGGRIRINGAVTPAARRLRGGDIIEVLGASEPMPVEPVAIELPVLFESATAIVVIKPSGLPTVPDRSGRDPGVHGTLNALRPDGDLRIVHRLDRDTSGCLLLAKGLEAARHFDLEFREQRMHKRYCALVHGVFAAASRSIDAWLGPDTRRPGKIVAAAEPRRGYREAHTEARLRIAFTRHSLLDLQPRTGRSHQLRVHLASIGHPIVGDGDYGGQPLLLSQFKRGYKSRVGFVEKPLVDRTFLHAEALQFRDVDGGDVAVAAPMPEDLVTALGKLERFASPPPANG